ncbi:nephrin [Latimeria chalumnae]|uniref:nephrin n=1 Tax=Latimeria chalumnae TaxID=7897 RepID=UPI00313DC998
MEACWRLAPGLRTLSYCLFSLWTVQGSLQQQQQAFQVEPDDTTVREGETAILICQVSNPSGDVQWVKDGLLLGPDRTMPGFSRYSMVGNSSKGDFHLQIEHAQLADDAAYECQVGRSQMSHGIVSRTALLSVLVPPKKPQIKEHSEDTVITWVAGVEYTVTCTVEDAKPAAEIRFTKSGVELSGDDSMASQGSDVKLFNTESVIKITPESSDNGNQVACAVLNPAVDMPIVAGFTVNVLFPPQPPRIEGYSHSPVKAGETLKLICVCVGGNPLATLQWLKNGSVVSTSWETEESTNTARSFFTLKVKPEHNMVTLTCEASNLVTSTPLKSSISLKVIFLPSEVKILGSPSVGENKQLAFSCFTASSNPPVQIRWWLGWRELHNTEVTVTEADNGGQVTMSNLTHTALREENGLPLTCEAFNRAILYTKVASLTLRVLYPPDRVWIEGPAPRQTFRAGTKVNMTCFASGGNPSPNLIWIKETKAIKDGTLLIAGKLTAKSITITMAPNDNDATYRCNATNVLKAPPLTASTRLHVQFLPIDVKIVSLAKTVKRGESLTLTCTAGSSNPVASISWIKDGEKLDGQPTEVKKAEYGGESMSGKITIVALSSDNGKRVTCEAYSAVLSESTNMFYELNILYPPEFAEDQVKLVQAVEHYAALIPLKVSANPAEVTHVWSFKGQVLLKEGAPRHHLKEDGSLEIWNLTRADSGNYRIRCKNDEGENETSIRLDVHYSPSIKRLGDPTEVDLGGTAEIVCVADMNPVMSSVFTWQWMGDEERTFTPEQQIVQGATGKLVITEATRSDAGRYKCTVDNGIPPPVDGEARLVVRFTPEILKGLHLSKVATLGDGSSTATLICKAEGVPNVDFSWAKKGVALDLENPRYSEKTIHEGSIHTSLLSIANVSAVLDYAVFTCTARNPLGLDVFDIQLVSTSRPDPPTELKCVSFSHNSVTLQWTAGFNGGLEQKFRVRYHWDKAPSFMYVDVFPPQATTFTITGLIADTPYNISVNAINALGESDYADGAFLTVTTLEWKEEETRPDAEEPGTPSLPSPGPPLPVYLIVLLGLLGGILFVSNASFLTCLIRKRRAGDITGDGKTMDGSKLSERNQYGDAELINTTAKQTLLIDSGSECTSSTYESYEGGSSTSTDRDLHYYPISQFRPSLYPHRETSDEQTEDSANPSSGQKPPGQWKGPLDSHEYEEVMDSGLYEEVGGPYQQSHAAYHIDYIDGFPLRREGLSHQGDSHMGVYQRRRRGHADYEEPIRVYDTVAEASTSGGDYELPFHPMGELVQEQNRPAVKTGTNRHEGIAPKLSCHHLCIYTPVLPETPELCGRRLHRNGERENRRRRSGKSRGNKQR